MAPVELPVFDELTLDPSGPKGNAWGLFGKDNSLGMLNLLTPDVVKAAASEIKDGVRFALDWQLNALRQPAFGRQAFDQKIVFKAPRIVNDDVLTFNTQSSSQWDGFRHYGNQTHKVFYNGTTQQMIESSSVLGIDAWVQNGGVVGRGVLLDIASYAERNNIELPAFESTVIPLELVKRVAEEENVTFRPGDILFIRSGFTKAFEKLSEEEAAALGQRPVAKFVGIESSEATLRWFWQNKFAAVAGDAVAVESAPVQGPQIPQEWSLHQWCLAGWGMPLGEMFYLEKLASHCAEKKRWTFFFSSVPLNVPGGVASPPNGVAIL
ncbi:hypothetical protein BGW36DRAFT_458878 [Talaromyces proteolyticus]|uniref:Cyclase-domain-containing protein n=1 Tax=Talaromyces proteolyticus TaxID=1131652 RepID=A0AAD4KXI8_9EURO|nr:uncharacterized protein BGW36DRAFT_458878 [Talaromyces proteolyticus]KAH8702100.1 hypothetical protein BGW36DRAFT_458878 [Talaromyces proteolyticus]